MASFITGSRPRRAAVLRCLLVCALASQTGSVIAQQSGAPNGFHGPTGSVTDGGWDQPACEPSCGACGCGVPCEDCEASCGCAVPCEQHHKKYFGGWVGAEWLHWQLDGNRLPPLVTDGPVTPPNANVAKLNDPSTRILSGDETVNDRWRDGYRLYGGIWLNCCHTWGLGGDYFSTGNDNYSFTSENDPTRVVGRPFFNTELGIDDVELVSVPGQLDGIARVKSGDDFQGAGVTFTHCLWRCCDPCCSGNESQVAALCGYRYYKYGSDLSITENLTVLEGTQTPLVPGTTFFVQDIFRTRNEFNGGEIGLQGYQQHCWWWVDGMAKVAIGNQRRTVIVDGQTITTVPDDSTVNAVGGILTSSETNIGTYHDSDVVVIPEFRLGVGAMLTRCWAVHAGYNLIVWSDVARAASHLPPGLEVDPRNIPPVQAGGGSEPEFPGIRGSQLVAHGFDLSLTWQF